MAKNNRMFYNIKATFNISTSRPLVADAPKEPGTDGREETERRLGLFR